MKKIVLISLILIALFIGLFILTGCDNKSEEGSKASTSGDVQEKYDEFKIYDETIELNEEKEFKKMSFMTNTKKLSSYGGDNNYSINYEDDTKGDDIIVDYGATVVSISIRCFEGKTVEEVMSQAPYERTNKTVAGVDYEYFDYVSDGINGYAYAYNHDGSTYTITFEAKIDITSLIDAFMKNVKFN